MILTVVRRVASPTAKREEGVQEAGMMERAHEPVELGISEDMMRMTDMEMEMVVWQLEPHDFLNLTP
jgi:hypothetical protein